MKSRMLFVITLLGCSGGEVDVGEMVQAEINPDADTCYEDPTTGTCICAPPESPIVVDLAGDGYGLTAAADGVPFELVPNMVHLWAWTGAGDDDAFLAIDVNRNGFVDDGTELLGNNTLQATGDQRNGFVALAFYDRTDQGGNVDGRIDESDAVWSRLLLWRDINHDGVSQPAELIGAARGGLSSISLEYQASSTVDQNGNEYRFSSSIIAEAPVSTTVYDVWLRGRAIGAGGSTGSGGTSASGYWRCQIFGKFELYSSETPCNEDGYHTTGIYSSWGTSTISASEASSQGLMYLQRAAKVDLYTGRACEFIGEHTWLRDCKFVYTSGGCGGR